MCARHHLLSQIKEDKAIGYFVADVVAMEDSEYESELSRLNAAADEQGAVVRQTKENLAKQVMDGGTSVNQHPYVQEAVQVMKSLRSQATMLQAKIRERTAAASKVRQLALDEMRCEGPIWDIRPVELHFEAPDRPTARLLAQELVSKCCPDRPEVKK
jgi:hypothetical protein